ncbi:RNA polymerase II elongation factor ELL3 [Balearica regulorum gibbericeps]|uniref:RNA polymerase II elongation factor ELL3 n=1 Tax=Balearica regulorum gibbericeps TaxID=100784 RepID=UPI003F601627
MPRPRAELRGRLRYRGCGPGPRLSLLHVRLSAAAARALRGCGRRQGAPGPVIAFQGSQGCLTVPGGPGTPPQLFAFSLSRCSQDEPHGSFECVRLAVPRLGQGRLDSLGSIQQKITVCAWESSCPPLRERVSPAKEPRSRAAAEPDLAVLGYGKGITAPEKASMTSLLGKGSACHVPESRSHRPATASPRASVQSLVQPRCKHELLQQLGGMSAGRPSGTQLLAAPEEVRGASCGAFSGTGVLQHAHRAALPPGHGSHCPREGDPGGLGTRGLRRVHSPGVAAGCPAAVQEPGPQTLRPDLLGASAAASGAWLPSGHWQKPSGGEAPGTAGFLRSESQQEAPGPGVQPWLTKVALELPTDTQHAAPRSTGPAASWRASWGAGEPREQGGDARSQAGSSSLADIPDYLR